MRDLRLLPLTTETIAKAYPLMQIARPSVLPEDWQLRAQAFLSEDDPSRLGIQTLQGSGGLIVGLFAYYVVETRDHGRTLYVEDFVAVDIVASAQVLSRLAQEMEDMARQLRCRAVHTAVACEGYHGKSLIKLLSELGHRAEITQFCKQLPPLP